MTIPTWAEASVANGKGTASALEAFIQMLATVAVCHGRSCDFHV